MPAATAPAPSAAAGGVPFVVASRPFRRFSAAQTVNTTNGPTSFAPIPLIATGYVRRITMYFQATFTCASAGALVAGDAPFNLINGITLSDATGQPVQQPLSGYNTYLVNKYLAGGVNAPVSPKVENFNPIVGPEYVYATTSTTGTATFRLDLFLEQDPSTGWGCIPNLDSNASLQLKIDAAQITNAFSGTGVSLGQLSVIVSQWYWAPVGPTTGGVSNVMSPPGNGDFVGTRYETQTVSPSSENTVTCTNRGGIVKAIIAVSRAAGVRTAFTPATNVGLIYDNVAVDEGIRLEEQYNFLRRAYGYLGADSGTALVPVTPAGTITGLDVGVLPWVFGAHDAGYRQTWLPTRTGTQLQLKLTPGAGASQIELITQIAEVRDPAAFYKTGD